MTETKIMKNINACDIISDYINHKLYRQGNYTYKAGVQEGRL